MSSQSHATQPTTDQRNEARERPCPASKLQRLASQANSLVGRSICVAIRTLALLIFVGAAVSTVLTTTMSTVAAKETSSPVEFRIGFFNIYLGLADTSHRAAVVRQIQRTAPDIMGLSEINNADHSLLPTLVPGLPNVVTQPGGLQPALLTRYPVLSSGSLGSTAPANEFRRKHLWAVLDVGHESRNLLVYVVHTESWCYKGPCANVKRPALEFPRAIEWMRLKQDIQAKLKQDPNLDVVVMGDWNDDNRSPQTDAFAAQPDGVFSGFVLGADIGFPVQHAPYPNYQCEQAGLRLLESTDTDGNRNTVWAGTPNPALQTAVKIDYIAHSEGIKVAGHEVFNSEVSDPDAGLRKYGEPLNVGDSRAASDHLMVFADMAIE
ncbi:endonuclease/exonuclease/phosphatase family protein [Rosistilla oblonga]|uniref:endonuclease/exonuclease/phosphatase family protein n=1 Tax=Rosistilla oblonga TaxID=2527990 RepID=UPI003A979844